MGGGKRLGTAGSVRGGRGGSPWGVATGATEVVTGGSTHAPAVRGGSALGLAGTGGTRGMGGTSGDTQGGWRGEGTTHSLSLTRPIPSITSTGGSPSGGGELWWTKTGEACGDGVWRSDSLHVSQKSKVNSDARHK